MYFSFVVVIYSVCVSVNNALGFAATMQQVDPVGVSMRANSSGEGSGVGWSGLTDWDVRDRMSDALPTQRCIMKMFYVMTSVKIFLVHYETGGTN